MDYLEAALELKLLIRKVNHLQIQKESTVLGHKNSLFLFRGSKPLAELPMTEFTNEFVNSALSQYSETTALVMTDLTSMMLKDRQLTYWLYKGYHIQLEKGMVYFQPIDEQSLTKQGRLQYSNLESNLFFKLNAPDCEESTCNAMETDVQEEGAKHIVFFIGNMNEERLLFDVQRLIFDTLSNVQNHKNIRFYFILNISKFGSHPSGAFLEQLKVIDNFTAKYLVPEYPNASFQFDIEK